MGIDQLVTGGDVDDPIVDSLNTKDLIYGKSRKEVKQIESFDEDTDGSTDLDLEVSVDVTDRNYEYQLTLVITDPPSSTGDLLIKFNNSGSKTYDQTTIQGSDFNGNTEFQSGITDFKTRKRFYLFPEARPNLRELTLSQSTKSIDRGKCRAIEADQLDTIQLFTSGLSCAGYAYIVEVSDQ